MLLRKVKRVRVTSTIRAAVLYVDYHIFYGCGHILQKLVVPTFFYCCLILVRVFSSSVIGTAAYM